MPSTRCCCGWKALRVQEVRDAEAFGRPALEVARRGGEVLGVVWERGSQGADAGHDLGDVGLRVGVGGGIRDRAVLDLEALDRAGGGLETQPGVARLGARSILDDLGFADDRLRGVKGGAGHVNLRSVDDRKNSGEYRL